MLSNCGIGKASWDSLGLQGDQTSQSWRESTPNIHWKDWCWGWSSNTFSSVQFSHSVVSNSLQPRELQHIRPPCPSPTPGVHPNPSPLSWWCHPTISSSVVPPLAFNLSKHQGVFKLVSSLHQVAKVLEFQPQHQSFQWTPRTDLL